jgi:hypothetical protein
MGLIIGFILFVWGLSFLGGVCGFIDTVQRCNELDRKVDKLIKEMRDKK